MQPQIITYLKSSCDYSALLLHIENIGEGCSQNVKGRFFHDVKQFNKNRCISSFPIFQDGIGVFPAVSTQIRA